MITKTMEQIEARIQNATTIPAEKRKELLVLLRRLKAEVSDLPSSQEEEAESLRRFIEISTHEATRVDRDPHLLQLSVDGLSQSVKAFETSHPLLADSANDICFMLANLGI